MIRFLVFVLIQLITTSLWAQDDIYRFTEADINFLNQFSLVALPAQSPSLSNLYADNHDAAKLGQALFFDQRLSQNRAIACATCHQPQRYFTDGLKTSRGLQKLRRNAPSLLGAGYGPWLYWDGRKDSLWAQALAPLLDPHEQGSSSMQVAEVVRQYYWADYKKLFGEQALDEQRILVNVGKALMAYQRRLTTTPSSFDNFVDAINNNANAQQLREILTPDAVSGLRLFMGKAGCVSCHNGPLFTNFEFHNIGVPEADKTNVDLGRYTGIEKLRNDDFTCLSQWSDAKEEDCLEMAFLKKQGQELIGAFKTPSLRNVARTAPYMHNGHFATLEEVVSHYNKPTPPEFIRGQHPQRPHFDILPLNLTDEETQQLVAFLESLTSPIASDDPWWRAP